MSTKQQLDLFDFDSTLFDLIGFARALPLAIEAEFGISAAAFAIEIPNFYVGKIGYDIYAHLAHYKQDLHDEAIAARITNRTLAMHKQLTGEDDLLFADARDALRLLKTEPNRHLAIMSVNLVSCFLFKRRQCGTILNDIAYQVVKTNKGEILARKWASGDIVYNGVTYASARFIDDGNTQVEQAPKRSDVERIQIVRDGQRYPRTNDPDIRVIGSLVELAKKRA
jgi:hypothetical protein